MIVSITLVQLNICPFLTPYTILKHKYRLRHRPFYPQNLSFYPHFLRLSIIEFCILMTLLRLRMVVSYPFFWISN